jgi:hypothetical protein
MNILPEAEKALLSHFNELGAEEVRKRLNLGDFGKEGSPKYKFALCYLKEDDRRAKQEMLVESSVRLQHEGNELARAANEKSRRANIISAFSLGISVIAISMTIFTLFKG